MSPETIQSLKKEALRYKQAAQKIEEVISFFEQNSARTIPLNGAVTPTTTIESDHQNFHFANLPQAEVCFILLKEHGAPLTRQELVDRAAERGKIIKGPDSLSPILSRDSRFKSFGRDKWGIAPEHPYLT